jgi:hypothetical protein
LNDPDADVVVIVAIFHSRFPQELGLSAVDATVAAEVQLPVDNTLATSDGDTGLSCFVSTHAMAATARPIATINPVVWILVIAILI